MSTKKMKIDARVKSAEVLRGHIKATDIMEEAFHGSHYRITSAWPNVIYLTPLR